MSTLCKNQNPSTDLNKIWYSWIHPRHTYAQIKFGNNKFCIICEPGELSRWLESWWQHHKHCLNYYYYYYSASA